MPWSQGWKGTGAIEKESDFLNYLYYL